MSDVHEIATPNGYVRYVPEARHLTQIAALEAQLAEARGSFKNFHRLLCERFGYGHDEKDWQRDQLSLIEHIAVLERALSYIELMMAGPASGLTFSKEQAYRVWKCAADKAVPP